VLVWRGTRTPIVLISIRLFKSRFAPPCQAPSFPLEISNGYSPPELCQLAISGPSPHYPQDKTAPLSHSL
jgi:hypothetical protein